MGKVETGLAHVEVNAITCKKEINKNKDMEYAYHGNNIRKLSQISNNPFIHGQIAHAIGFNGTSRIFLKILQGHSNDPPDTDDYTNAYLKHLRRAPNIIEPPKAIVPTKIFQEGWSKMKECTSAGIPGLHFGKIKEC